MAHLVAIAPAGPARSLFPEHRLIGSAGVMGHVVFKFDRNPQGSAAEPKRPLIGIADRRTGIASTIEPCSRAVRRPRARNIYYTRDGSIDNEAGAASTLAHALELQLDYPLAGVLWKIDGQRVLLRF